MKIGLVDLDTSHASAWLPIEREMGHEIVGVWDGGSIHPAGYAEKFAKENGIPRVFSSLNEMVPMVDCAILHGTDWDTHVERARPFVEHGCPILVDKPIAGNPRDIAQFSHWAHMGAKITGSSSLRFCYEVRNWLAKPVAERGTPHTSLVGCGVDEFNYGIHAWSMLCGLMGSGIVSVRHLAEGPQRRVQVNWADGRMAFVAIGEVKAYLPFHASVVTDRGVHQIKADNGKLYKAMLEVMLPWLAGKGPEPAPFHELIEAEQAAVAARRSWMHGNKEVRLADLGNSADGYDGKKFAEFYRKQKYP